MGVSVFFPELKCDHCSLLSRVSFLTWPSSPACLRFQASAPGSKACLASTERKDATLTYCLSKNGGRWNWPQTRHQVPLQPRPSANWSELANGCIMSACATFWSLLWCASAPGTFTGRRGEAMPSTPSQTFTCRMALRCGGSTGVLTRAPRVWPTRAASWWTIVISWTTRRRTVLFICRIRLSKLQNRFWDWCHSFRRTANCARDEDTIIHILEGTRFHQYIDRNPIIVNKATWVDIGSTYIWMETRTIATWWWGCLKPSAS